MVVLKVDKLYLLIKTQENVIIVFSYIFNA